ncbi:MAG: PspC domain-containing protein [Waddliaceae bacterium]|jgi:phage shock protein C|nr:PspC domain-containing protein [Waddliaceae bacterium]MBT3579360.1 PspC domain-containing protein [Waddliaceae bacterium]MBT4444850.1 PspC domain-containing protein [Waddliaceae bacterium]MBT6928014.1 PspC domain-containing protein [Waddliaceae bacterium]MBT7264310.1 PspC domain-containing protein [Waddliaceae bacterium]
MKHIHRSRKNKMVAGICGGIAEMYSWDPSIVRLAFVFLALATNIMPLVVTYALGWFIIPIKTHNAQSPRKK